MTFAETADRYAPKSEDIIGPYSPWPRRSRSRRGSVVSLAMSVAAVGLIVHTGLPILF